MYEISKILTLHLPNTYFTLTITTYFTLTVYNIILHSIYIFKIDYNFVSIKYSCILTSSKKWNIPLTLF